MDSTAQSNILEVSVSELSGKLKKVVEDTFGYVRVRGEISGFRGPHSSGHCYFALKDDRARLEAVIWRGQAAKLKHMPEEGLEVIASGKLTTYPGSSKYQIVIDSLEPAGAGALMALLEERKRKLAAEGLFDEARKQLLPYMPKVIGVVTSPTGAVIRDVLHRISDRFPVHVIVWPVRVQGDTSGPEVANAIYGFNTLPGDGPIPRPDLIIVARGGGSLEDLWGFNDEIVVRAAAESMIPLIAAVGHETDWTLIDLAADWRAPTPTAAAEKAVPVKAEIEAQLADDSARLKRAMSRALDVRRTDLRAASRGLTSADMLLAMPRRRFDEAAGRLARALEQRAQRARDRYHRFADRLTPAGLERTIARTRERLSLARRQHGQALSRLVAMRRQTFDATARQLRPLQIANRLQSGREQLERSQKRHASAFKVMHEQRQSRLSGADRLLASLSYHGVLARGYAVVRDAGKRPVTGISGFSAGETLYVEMQDGTLAAQAGHREENPAGGGAAETRKPAAGKKKTAKRPDGQGSLF